MDLGICKVMDLWMGINSLMSKRNSNIVCINFFVVNNLVYQNSLFFFIHTIYKKTRLSYILYIKRQEVYTYYVKLEVIYTYYIKIVKKREIIYSMYKEK